MNLSERVGRERLLFGHRGTPQEAPENTLSSFRRALELGLDGVELDVQYCRTQELIIFHDDGVDRLTDGTGRICELAFEEISRLDAGARFGEKFKGEKIPSLEQVLELLGGKMLVNIELKTKSIRDDGLEAKVAALIRRMNVTSSVILSSFNPFSVRRVKQQGPDLVTALLYAEDQPFYLRRGWSSRVLALDGIHPRYPLINEKLLRRARSKRWFVGTWTVDSAAVAAWLYHAGVNVVISNRPAQLREELKREREKLN